MPGGTFSRVPRVAGLATLRWTSQYTPCGYNGAGEGWLRRPLRTPRGCPLPLQVAVAVSPTSPLPAFRATSGLETPALPAAEPPSLAPRRLRETGGPALTRAPALRPPVPPISGAGEPAPPSGVGFRPRSPPSGDRTEPPTGPKVTVRSSRGGVSEGIRRGADTQSLCQPVSEGARSPERGYPRSGISVNWRPRLPLVRRTRLARSTAPDALSAMQFP